MYNIYNYVQDWFWTGYHCYCIQAELFQPTMTYGINSVMTYEQSDLHISTMQGLTVHLNKHD
jgi:hypothetical protein